ncbi:50S ribosomal subunit-associated GTPase HflX (HflX) (PDB:2QTF) (PUBMED:22905870) [Commensalibacter communis]|uniref:GTPase HflX n=1 Tax=Commensalibacter communis TaxID=2972786 RepID=UPI0022FF71F2|nr:GTPase HflX [Commensalibacter communis]CAI3934499.1 50S ribosomal subunit-associated GTPase HflX (HflX) (PDB:2QTF) (PUBMED:22905870) [Commensalibacter communis]CAI3940377.1 50S ribosomal subunit-associated GTPase HflX (HflX) (PDB:2QTF) (PUBMED:22905870) [Commensalibacter communis]CAI3943709.1 50S ribosomal subunit-associated GTPase HflX (HflX) (PDB:2QTF) (PUBMED:22905870) [Commensalibacter communis]
MTNSDSTHQNARAAVIVPWDVSNRQSSNRNSQSRLEEAIGLASSIHLDILHTEIINLRSYRSATLIGQGHIEQLKDSIISNDIEIAIFDTRLSPIQQRNLEKALDCKVIDRTALILDIFGERAQTKEGTLQVELAHLQYQRSRLVRSWTHLERQRGGFGFMGGPGETQIEADRRLIDERIIRLKKDLEQVRRTRGLHRKSRQKVPFPIVALIGYTNAGKSTLFNNLTGADVHAQDQLFATLDPTMRKLQLPSGKTIILSDTVGFISDLPTELIAAFRATLEETAEADIILHVRDISHPETTEQRQDVFSVLDTMVKDQILEADWRKNTIEVLNKIDLTDINTVVDKPSDYIGISALTGENLPALIQLIDNRLAKLMEKVNYTISIKDGAALSWLYNHGEILERNDDEDTITLFVRLSPANKARFEQIYSY